MEKLSRKDFVLFLLAVVGLLSFIVLYPGLYPTASVKLRISQNEIIEVARRTVDSLGYDLKGYVHATTLERDREQIHYLESAFGTERANRIMQDSIPGHFWQVKWNKPSKLSDIVVGSSDKRKRQEAVQKELFSDFLTRFDLHGRLLEFRASLPDSAPGADLSEDIAKAVAVKFLARIPTIDLQRYDFVEHVSKKLPRRTDHTFRWNGREVVAGEKALLTVSIQGDRVGSYELDYDKPEGEHRGALGSYVIRPLLIGVVYLGLFIVLLVTFIRKLRSDEIGLRSGLVFGIVCGVAMLVKVLVAQQDKEATEALIALIASLVFLVPLVGLGIGLVLTTGEATARGLFDEKLVTLDALIRWRVLFPRMGRSILHGIALGFISLGLLTLTFKAGSALFHLRFSFDESEVAVATAYVPALYVLADVLAKAVFRESVFRLFSLSLLGRWLNSKVWMILAGATLWSVGDVHFFAITPFGLHIAIHFLVGLIFGYFFLQYDFITVLIGAVTLILLRDVPLLLTAGPIWLTWNGVALLGFLGALLLIGIVASLRKVSEEELLRYRPSYVTRMVERERLKRELEIAQRVQLSFLPKDVPYREDLEIATLCIPAREVGGDYYDFVDLGNGRLGVVIGDVSGKGISAAFYMALVKGMFKSESRDHPSPREMLVELNARLYEEASRGVFISMIYGIFDRPSCTLTLARAGHNPVVIGHGTKGETESICPKGIALGLDRGELFARSIEEQQLRLNPGDVFVFYTDGFTEAMNGRNDEFGEDRLQALLEQHTGKSPQEILQIMEKQVRDFVGKIPQHDDMTMVVVKVKHA